MIAKHHARGVPLMSTRIFLLAGAAALTGAPVAAQPAKVDAAGLRNAGTPKEQLRGA
jgi:hypothetical protein